MATNIDELLHRVPYQNRKRVKDDIARLMFNVKTLIPKQGTLIHNNGSESKLVLLAGTVPIYYQSVQYNIPVEIFITENYPTEPPKIYVRPTPNMTIKANHRHVDMQGLVFLPYLHEWKSESTLSGLVEITSNVFSIEPPLFSRPTASLATTTSAIKYPTYSPPTAALVSNTPPVIPSYNAGSGMTGSVAATSSYAYSALQAPTNSYSAVQQPTNAYVSATPVVNNSPYQTTPAVASAISYNNTATYTQQGTVVPGAGLAALSPYSATSSSSSSAYNSTMTGAVAAATVTPYSTGHANIYGITSTTNVNTTAGVAQAEAQKAKEKRARLIAEVTARMREDLQVQQVVLRDELDTEFATERYLEQSGAAARQNIADLKASIAEFTSALLVIEAKDKELTQWEETQKTQPPLEVESRLEPFDDLAAQVVRVNAELNAIDDAFYFLERALVDESNKTVDLTSFLKETRRLARQQFMCKAHLMKINASTRPQHLPALPQQQQQTPQQQYYAQQPHVPGTYSPTLQPYQQQQQLNYLQPAQFNPQPTGYQQNGIATQDWPQVPTTSAAATIAAQNPPTQVRKKNGPKLTVL